jgi:hypothetical protein
MSEHHHGFVPPYTHPATLLPALRQQGFALLPAADVAQLAQCTLPDLAALGSSWDLLAPDAYLKDGGKYRKRRHASYVIGAAPMQSAPPLQGTLKAQSALQVQSALHVQATPHRAHWQPLEYNALHGGMQRWFEPVAATTHTDAWHALLRWMALLANQLRSPQPWYAEAHQFRIDTEGGIGRPTPEGAHRDGVDLVAVFLVARQGVKGGETRVFETDGPRGQRFTLTEPWSVLLLDDARVVHETTPIQPTADGAHRDTLVLTLRAKSFQDAA